MGRCTTFFLSKRKKKFPSSKPLSGVTLFLLINSMTSAHTSLLDHRTEGEDYTFRITRGISETVKLNTPPDVDTAFKASLLRLRNGMIGTAAFSIEERLVANVRFFLDVPIQIVRDETLRRITMVLQCEWGIRPDKLENAIVLLSATRRRFVFPLVVVAWQTFEKMVYHIQGCLTIMSSRGGKHDFHQSASPLQLEKHQFLPFSCGRQVCKPSPRSRLVCSGCNNCDCGVRFLHDTNFVPEARLVDGSLQCCIAPTVEDIDVVLLASCRLFGATEPRLHLTIPYNAVHPSTVKFTKPSGTPLSGTTTPQLALVQQKLGKFLRKEWVHEGRKPYAETEVRNVFVGKAATRIQVGCLGTTFCSTCGMHHGDALTFFTVKRKDPSTIIQESKSKEAGADGKKCFERVRATRAMPRSLADLFYPSKEQGAGVCAFDSFGKISVNEEKIDLCGGAEFEGLREEDQRLQRCVMFVSVRMKKAGYSVDSDGNVFQPMAVDDMPVFYHRRVGGLTVKEVISNIDDAEFNTMRLSPTDVIDRIVVAIVKSPSCLVPRLEFSPSSQISFRDGVYDIVANVFYPLADQASWPGRLEEAKKLHSKWTNHGMSVFEVSEWQLPSRTHSSLSFQNSYFGDIDISKSRFVLSEDRVFEVVCGIVGGGMLPTLRFSHLSADHQAALREALETMLDRELPSNLLETYETPKDLVAGLKFNLVDVLGDDIKPFLGLDFDSATVCNLFSLLGRCFFARQGARGPDDWQVCLFMTGLPRPRAEIVSLLKTLFGDTVYDAQCGKHTSEAFPFSGLKKEHRHVLFNNVPADSSIQTSVFQSQVSQESVRLAQKNALPLSFDKFDKYITLSGVSIPTWTDSHGALLRRLINLSFMSVRSKLNCESLNVARLCVGLSYAYVGDLTYSQGGSFMRLCASNQLKDYQTAVAAAVQPLRAHITSSKYAMAERDSEDWLNCTVPVLKVKQLFDQERREAGLPLLPWCPSLYEPVFYAFSLELRVTDGKDYVVGAKLVAE